MPLDKINAVLATVRHTPRLQAHSLEIFGGGYRAYLNAPVNASMETLEKRFDGSTFAFRGSGWDYNAGHYIVLRG